MPSLARSLPLYRGLGFLAREEAQPFDAGLEASSPHPGLVFDKFIDTWSIGTDGACVLQDPGKKRGDSPKRQLGSKRAWLEETLARYDQMRNTLEAGLERALERQKRLIAALGGSCMELTTDWRLVSGLGNGHPLEAGFIWHRTLGVPYLPGSSVKGALRAWVDSERGWGDPNTWNKVRHLFGDSRDEGAGSLIVLDALPADVPKVELDILNPHYGDYYRGDHPSPADYLSPKPVFFLAVAPRQRFLFALAPRPGASLRQGRGDDCERGMALLEAALRDLGVGGKTAVGYGTIREDWNALEHRLQGSGGGPATTGCAGAGSGP